MWEGNHSPQGLPVTGSHADTSSEELRDFTGAETKKQEEKREKKLSLKENNTFLLPTHPPSHKLKTRRLLRKWLRPTRNSPAETLNFPAEGPLPAPWPPPPPPQDFRKHPQPRAASLPQSQSRPASPEPHRAPQEVTARTCCYSPLFPVSSLQEVRVDLDPDSGWCPPLHKPSPASGTTPGPPRERPDSSQPSPNGQTAVTGPENTQAALPRLQQDPLHTSHILFPYQNGCNSKTPSSQNPKPFGSRSTILPRPLGCDKRPTRPVLKHHPQDSGT